jgi:TPP-dependent pyruvate/acetoin dehydrogenase alpha subunit
MDVMAVLNAATEAVQHIRETGAPVFIECQTYRFRAHSMFDPELYRDPEEVKRWKLRDPIPAFLSKAVAAGQLLTTDLDLLEKEVAVVVQEAVAFAEQGTLEPVEDLLRHVYSEREILQSVGGVK